MRDLQFWYDRYKAVCAEIRTNGARAHMLETMVGGLQWMSKYKLKKMWGHALNRDYTGYKIQHRRKKWLFRRAVLTTRIAKLKATNKRLEVTKLRFYEERIRALGGNKPSRW